VTAKCYGGDITPQAQAFDKQKEGKKKMRQFGKVDIPQEASSPPLKMDAIESEFVKRKPHRGEPNGALAARRQKPSNSPGGQPTRKSVAPWPKSRFESPIVRARLLPGLRQRHRERSA